MTKKNSDARLKANNEYNKRAYKTFNLRMKPYQNIVFSEYCKMYKYGKNEFLIAAMKEKIERDTGKSFDEFLKEIQSKQEEQTENKNIESNSEIVDIDNN